MLSLAFLLENGGKVSGGAFWLAFLVRLLVRRGMSLLLSEAIASSVCQARIPMDSNGFQWLTRPQSIPVKLIVHCEPNAISLFVCALHALCA